MSESFPARDCTDSHLRWHDRKEQSLNGKQNGFKHASQVHELSKPASQVHELHSCTHVDQEQTCMSPVSVGREEPAQPDS